ncbi:MAG: DUF3526 domain-containing protein [Bacteroidetes bacterium]|nr:DUF3526 domain-containing protein [Bacteroidota bacterium]
MTGKVLKYELKSQFRSGRVKTLLTCTFFIWVLVLILGYRGYVSNQKQYEDSVTEARLNWENQTEKDPHDAAHDGTYVVRPYYPLVILDKGIHPYSGQVVHLGAHQRRISTAKESKDRSGLFRFGELTINFTLIYIFPLLIIFIGYNVVTTEKESQTIRLLAAQGVSFNHLCVGKWLAVFLQIILAFIPLVIAAIVFAIYFDNEGVGWVEWTGLLLIYVLYFMAFVSIVIFVSAKSKSSATSLVTLITIWILITLIIPKVSTNTSSMLYPFPTLQTFAENITEDKAKGINGHNFWNDAAQDFRQKVLKEYDVSSIEELPVEYSGLLLAEGEKYESEIYTKHFNLLQDQYQKQRNIYRAFGILSPMLPARFSSMALSRSDYGFLWHFEDQAEAYRLEFNTALNMDIAYNAKGIDDYKAEGTLWSSIPKFQYAWQPSEEIFQKHIPEFVILIAWAIGSFLLMLLSARTINIV